MKLFQSKNSRFPSSRFWPSPIKTDALRARPKLTAGFTPTPKMVSRLRFFLADYVKEKIKLFQATFMILLRPQKSRPSLVSGFTLIETFAAIIILLIAILGPLTLLSRAITDGLYAQNQITASFLLQEGLDLTIGHWEQLTKDNFDLNGADIQSCTSDSSACYVKVDDSGTVSFSQSGVYLICSASVSGLDVYQQDGSPCLDPKKPTIFTRKIWFEDIPTTSSDEASIFGSSDGTSQIGKMAHIQVQWTYKGIERTVNSSTMLLK